MNNRLMSLAVAAALFATAGAPGAARAAEPSRPSFTAAAVKYKDNGVRRWAVRPAGKDGKPDARTHFTLETTGGHTVDDAALVTNASPVPVTFRVYGTDAFNNSTGAFDLLAAARKPTDVGSWMVFQHSSITIGAGRTALVPFKIVVPADVTPGDHVGGVIVSTLAPAVAKGQKVNVESRVAVRLYLRIPGNLQPLLAVTEVDSRYHGVGNPLGHGHATISYTVTNRGNIRLTSEPTVIVSNALGRKVATISPGKLPELLPHASVTFTTAADRVFPAGPLTTKITLAGFADPQQPVGQTIPAISGNGYFWAVNWWLVALVGLVLFVLVAVLRWRRRQLLGRLRRTRDRLRRRPPLGDLPATAGTAGGAA